MICGIIFLNLNIVHVSLPVRGNKILYTGLNIFEERFMKKTLISIILAALLVLGLVTVSCDNGTTSGSGPVIPVELQGVYKAGGYTIRISANGSGSICGTPCTFSAANGVITIKMGAETVTVDYSVGTEGITFENIQAEAGVLLAVLTGFETNSPVEKEIPVQDAIPAALVGTWAVVNAVTDELVLFKPDAGDVVFDIEANGNGKVWGSYDGNMYSCTWSVTANKITLDLTGFSMTCTFDWAITSGKLNLSNATADNAGGATLMGYEDWGPFEIGSGGMEPGIDDFTWSSTIPSELVGIWKTLFDYEIPGLSIPFGGVTILTINTDGTGSAYMSAAPYSATCAFSVNTTNHKLKMNIQGFGSVMYDYSIVSDELYVTSPVPAVDAAAGMSSYPLFIPLEKDE